MGALPNGALPAPAANLEGGKATARDRLPDYLPARMVNEFVYCPRLFFYEWVEGVFRESVDTVEGKVQHERVEAKTTELPGPEEDTTEKIHARSVTLSSEQHRVIAKMDLLEAAEGVVTPVDYKHGAPRETENGVELWPTDRVQLAVQGLILRENGYLCEEGIVYYQKTRQRVRVEFDEELMGETRRAIAAAWELARFGAIPPPLVDSPKCPGCSLVPICLPDETNLLRLASELAPRPAVQLALFAGSSGHAGGAPPEPRQLIAPRDDLRPLYLNRQGARVGKSGEVLQIRDKDDHQHEVRLRETCQVNIMGNVQLSTQAVQGLCEAGIPICYFSQGGWFYGMTTGLNSKNVFLRRTQFRLAEEEWFAVSFARQLVAGKIRNQRTMLQRNHLEPKVDDLAALKRMAEAAERAQSLDELLGIEGNGARLYFQNFAGMIKVDDEEGRKSQFRFDFAGRNRRPPRDAVNALLSLGYSLLVKDLTIACCAVGFDPYLGFYHQPRFGRPALALDLMEPFRPLIADSAVLAGINTRMVTPKDFVQTGPAVALTPAGRKAFFHSYELRMDSLVTHPLFEYRVSYRRLLEIQARLLARVLEGEIGEYPVFVTR
jgi:CRISPR-associated protein Cas1